MLAAGCSTVFYECARAQIIQLIWAIYIYKYFRTASNTYSESHTHTDTHSHNTCDHMYRHCASSQLKTIANQLTNHPNRVHKDWTRCQSGNVKHTNDFASFVRSVRSPLCCCRRRVVAAQNFAHIIGDQPHLGCITYILYIARKSSQNIVEIIY